MRERGRGVEKERHARHAQLVVPGADIGAGASGPPLRAAAVGVAAVGAAWMLVNGEVEGDILFVVTRGHGMTEADIPAVVLFVVAAVLVVRSWRAPRPPDPPRGDPPTLPAPAASPEQQGGPLSRRPSRRRAS